MHTCVVQCRCQGGRKQHAASRLHAACCCQQQATTSTHLHMEVGTHVHWLLLAPHRLSIGVPAGGMWGQQAHEAKSGTSAHPDIHTVHAKPNMPVRLCTRHDLVHQAQQVDSWHHCLLGSSVPGSGTTHVKSPQTQTQSLTHVRKQEACRQSACGSPVELAADEVEGEWSQLLQPHNGHIILLALALTLCMQLIEHLRDTAATGTAGVLT